MAGRWRIGVTLAGCMLTLWAPSAGAQTPPTGSLTLVDGINQALEQANAVQLAREQVNLDQATVRFTGGAFDSALQIGPQFEHREDAIEITPFYNQERVKRGFATGLHTGFGEAANRLDDQIKAGRADLPLCPTDGVGGVGGNYSSYVLTLPGSSLPVPICRSATQSLNTPSLDPLTTGGLDGSDLYRQALPFDPLASLQLQMVLSSAFRTQIATTAVNAQQEGAELLQTVTAAARIVEMQAGVIADRLGTLPQFVYSNTAALTGSFSKPLRNGSVFQFDASFNGQGILFRDKPIDPAFGGTDTPNSFVNQLELAWTQPLGRGSGRASVQAAERAAIKTVEADRYGYQQSAADQALATADAYFDLIAAQDSLALDQQSLVTERQLLDSTTRLIAAGEVPSADAARVRARTADVESDVASARLGVVAAQTRLADAMGLPAAAVTTLQASDVFPVRPYEADVETLSKNALTQRSDVKALTAFRDTSRILLTAAKADMRSRFDVRLSAGVAQAYRGPVFHSLGDENGQHLTNDLYAAYYNPVGFGRAFQQRLEPIGMVTVSYELPWGNNARTGRYAQALASTRQSDIRIADLDRTIENNLPKLTEDLRRARTEWEQRQDAVVQYESSWDSAQRQRAAGELTLVDTLLTEQQLTQARLALVQAKRDYASALAHLRREAGVLVAFSGAQPQVNITGIVDAR